MSSDADTPANHSLRIEAVIRHWGLRQAIQKDVEKLQGLLIEHSHEATRLSQANTLHGNTIPDHLVSDDHSGDRPAGDDPSAKGGAPNRDHLSKRPDLRMTASLDMWIGVRDPRPDSRLAFAGFAHPSPPGSPRLPQESAMPPGNSSSPSTPEVPTTLP
jgi:hypothetical protein